MKMQLSQEDIDFLAKNSDCNRDELQQQFDRFIEKHPNGSITKKDFRSIMKSCFPNKDFRCIEKRIFNMYDENRDGLISFKEFMVVLYIMSNGTPEQNLKQIFRVFDVNGDGTISKKEMKKIVAELQHMWADECDMDKKELAKSAFEEMDANHDGAITEDEFVQAIMSHEKLASMITLKIVQVFDPDLN